MLSVYKRIIFLSVLVGVGENNLDVLAAQMYYGIERIIGHVFSEQIKQTVAGIVFASVIEELQPGVEIGVVVDHCLDEFLIEPVVLEKHRVRSESDQGAVGFVCGDWLGLADEISAFEFDFHLFSVSYTCHMAVCGKGVDCFESDTVEAY